MGFAVLAKTTAQIVSLNMNELRKSLDENLTVELWPTAGKALNLTRGATYSAARAGQIKTLRFGRLLRVPAAWLRHQLDLVEPAA
jgi:hypothetical protein